MTNIIMEIKKIKIENWRNYSVLELNFNKITVLFGKNTSGKTNILEAINFLTNSRSFRTKEENTIKWKNNYSRVFGVIKKDDKIDEILIVLEKQERILKTVKINEQKTASSKLLKTFNCILFTPEEIELIYTMPEARRRSINLIISQLDIYYAHNLIYFNKALKQRNNLLKRVSENLAKREELDVWDNKLSGYAVFIINWRNKYIENINTKINNYYKLLSGDNHLLKIKYIPSINTNNLAGVLNILKENRNRDILTRVTTNGPHRDDFEFILDGRNVTTFASRGEFRTIILALKLSEVDYFFEHTGEKPILLLDDVFSELDIKRRDLLSQLFLNQQTIITTTDMEHISQNILDKADIINIDKLKNKDDL